MSLLVAIPVWSGDYQQVMTNLHDQFQRDGKCKHHAILFSDLSDVEHRAVLADAEQCFAGVTCFRYKCPKSGMPWPQPQNYAWQTATRLLASRSDDSIRGWLWWESDALPLKKGWLDALCEAYVKGKRPFMGHIVPGRGHMNGVAIYPLNVADYATKALIVKASPFDVVLSQEVGEKNITPANDLIYHCLKHNGGDAPFVMTVFEQNELEPSIVLAHGYRLWTPTSRKQPITVVITNHGRADQLWRAFQSCLTAGLENIVIVSTLLDPEVLDAHTRILKTHPATRIIAVEKDPGSNAAWLKGARAVETKWLLILHDDDAILPAFWPAISHRLESEVRFVLFDATFHTGTESRTGDHLLKKDAGVYRTSDLKERLLSAPRSISPVSGVFEREHVINVLSEFQENCAHRKAFQLTPTMQVGNDLLLWLRATELEGVFEYIDTPLVSYGSHAGSTTVQDQTSHANKLPIIYNALKRYWSEGIAKEESEGSTCATFCYLPHPTKATAFLRHLNSFKRAFPLHLITHSNIPGVITLKEFGPFRERGGMAPSDQYATLAFLHVVVQAKKMGLKYFILIENDCRFSADYWDQTMWTEFKAWPDEALFGGSPVSWHPWGLGYRESKKIIDYAYRYQQASGVSMAFEGTHSGKWGTAIYPNGALAIYSTDECASIFADLLHLTTASTETQAQTLASIHAFDLHVGRTMVRKYGVEETLRRTAFLPSVYSGCKDHHVPLKDRIKMWQSGSKVAVHHIKESELPW